MFARTRASRDKAAQEIDNALRELHGVRDGLAQVRGLSAETCSTAVEKLIKDYEKVKDSLYRLC